MEKLQIIAEYLHFLKVQKKWWMFPLIILLMLLGLLIGFSQGSPLGPLIYTVF